MRAYTCNKCPDRACETFTETDEGPIQCPYGEPESAWRPY